MKIDWEEAKTTIHFGIDSFINNLAETKRADKSYFDNWKFSLFNMVEEKYPDFPIKSLFTKLILSSKMKMQKQNLSDYTKKASSNISFICKNHYADIIKRELKFSGNQENTYENVNTPVNDIIQAHSHVLGKFDLSLEEEMKKLESRCF